MIYRIFFSFTSKDRAIKDALIERLSGLKQLSKNLELDTWNMDRDCYGRWDKKCSDELHISDAVVCLLSENVSPASVVYDEIREAKKLCDAKDLIFMPVLLTDNHNAGDLSDYTCIFATGRNTEDYFSEIYAKLESDITKRLEKPLTSTTCIRVRSREANQHFYGREKELCEIKELFASGNNVVVLTGMGGIGKTELAKEFARRYRDDFPDTYVISFSVSEKENKDGEKANTDSGYTFKDLVCSMAFENTPNKNDRDEIYRNNLNCLRKIDRQTLLIIDGCDISIDNIKVV